MASASAATAAKYCHPVAQGDVLPTPEQPPGAWLVFRPSSSSSSSPSRAGGGGDGGSFSVDEEMGKEEGVLCTRFALEVTTTAGGDRGRETVEEAAALEVEVTAPS